MELKSLSSQQELQARFENRIMTLCRVPRLTFVVGPSTSGQTLPLGAEGIRSSSWGQALPQSFGLGPEEAGQIPVLWMGLGGIRYHSVPFP